MGQRVEPVSEQAVRRPSDFIRIDPDIGIRISAVTRRAFQVRAGRPNRICTLCL